MLGKAFFAHPHVLHVLHGLIRLRALLVSIVCSATYISKNSKLQQGQEEGDREGMHDHSLRKAD